LGTEINHWTHQSKLNKTEKERVKPIAEGDLVIATALENDDASKLLDTFRTMPVSVGYRNKSLDHLISQSKFEEAGKVALEACNNSTEKKLNKKTIQLVCKIFQAWEESGEVLKTKEFVHQLSSNKAPSLKGDVWVKFGLARTDTNGYINLLKEEEQNIKKWMLSTDVLVESVSKKPEFVKELENLASQDFQPANSLLMKYYLAQENSDMFRKYLKESKSSIIDSGVMDKIDSIHKIEIIKSGLSELKAPPEESGRVIDNILRSNIANEKFVDFANCVLEDESILKFMSASVLENLGKSERFRLKSEVEKLLSS